jgi:hypothetical protein
MKLTNENTGNKYRISATTYMEDGTNYAVWVRPVDGKLVGSFQEKKKDGGHVVSQFNVTGCSTVQGCLESIECMLMADIEEGDISQAVYWRRPDLEVKP